MKGSPIISTLFAIIIMIGAYFIMYTSLRSNNSSSEHGAATTNIDIAGSTTEGTKVPAYIEAHFSSPPTSFAIYHPVSNKKIIQLNKLTDHEWSHEIRIPKGDSLELNVIATWEGSSETTENRQHFIQLVLSPDEKDDSSTTLRSMGDIDTTATFTWTP